jgi:hypothetical protein
MPSARNLQRWKPHCGVLAYIHRNGGTNPIRSIELAQCIILTPVPTQHGFLCLAYRRGAAARLWRVEKRCDDFAISTVPNSCSRRSCMMWSRFEDGRQPARRCIRLRFTTQTPTTSKKDAFCKPATVLHRYSLAADAEPLRCPTWKLASQLSAFVRS